DDGRLDAGLRPGRRLGSHAAAVLFHRELRRRAALATGTSGHGLPGPDGHRLGLVQTALSAWRVVEKRQLAMLLSARVAERHGESLARVARESKLELVPIVLPADPEGRADPSDCARIDAAYFSGD